ncbi:MAG: metallophosphoesterase [Ktedonobacteraceae bacterium]|nr:metallophosphoesterase [Ktedonobacteraceae bacterium]
MKPIKRRTLLKSVGIVTAGTTVMGGGILLYSGRVEPSWVEVISRTVHLPRLDRAFAGYRIVQLSDIHVDETWMDKGRLESIVEITNEQKPDLIVITGDFVTEVHASTRDTLSALQRLKARDGIFGILGNHDHWSDPVAVRTYLEAFGIHELNDKMSTLHRGAAMLHLVGMDDLWPDAGEPRPVWEHQSRLKRLLKLLPDQGTAILLVHEPDFADVAAATERIDLQLSGHSHGGQVRLPLFGAPIVPPLGQKYVAGWYTIQSMQHYTSRGLGMLPPQMRFNCRPEIAVFTCQTGVEGRVRVSNES